MQPCQTGVIQGNGQCRVQAARSELEGKEQGLRREAGRQMRELETGRGEALRQLQDAQAAASQREQDWLVGQACACTIHRWH